MRKHVPFLMMMAIVSFPLFAAPPAPPQRWTEFARTISCPETPGTPMEVVRCNQARAQFCGTLGNADCTLRTPNQRARGLEEIRAELGRVAELCKTAASDAQKQCFDNLGQRNAPEAQQTLQQMCTQMGQANANAERVNTEAGGRCQGVKGRCQTSCETAKAQVETLITSCGEPCASLRTSADFRLLADKGPWCASIRPEIALAQARENLNAGNLAERCRELTAGRGGVGSGTSTPSGGRQGDRTAGSGSGGSGMNPQMLMGLAQAAMALMNQQNQQPQQQPQAVNPALDPVDCGVNPTLAGCPTPAAAGSDSWNAKTAALESASTSDSSGGFNPADDSAMSPASADGNADPRAAGTPPTVGSVPNGGGGMPGGGGGAPASLGGGGGGGGAAGKTNTDVLQGFGGSGGGMGAMAANMNMKNGESGGGYSYGQGGYGQDEPGLDLSQFLPGGRQDPTRKIAGIAESANFQIQSKEVNIWSRISERIKARCSQGLLRDCIP